jgi:multidrug resistance protein, MATE family
VLSIKQFLRPEYTTSSTCGPLIQLTRRAEDKHSTKHIAMCVSETEGGSAVGTPQQQQQQQRTSYLQELGQQLNTSMPAMFSMLLYKIPWLLSLRFAGRMGSDALAAAALATTFCNVTGMSLSVGFSSAMTTLAGQARGEHLATFKVNVTGERKALLSSSSSASHDEAHYGATSGASDRDDGPILTLVYLYRGMLIQLLLVIPVGVWWIYGIQPFLLALGQGELISSMTQDYLRILAPGLWSFSVNWTFTSWLQAIEMADVPAYGAIVGVVLHIPFNILFIRGFGMGYLGVAMATVAFQLVQPVFMCIYLFGTKTGISRVLLHCGAKTRTTIPFWKEAALALSLSGILQYLSLALPGIIIISEWWASELCIFLSGTLSPSPNLALDGMTIYQSINTVCFMFPVGCSIAGSTRVGNFLGSGDTKGAGVAATVSVAAAAVLSAAMGSILFWTPQWFFPSLFSPDVQVVAEAGTLMPLLAVYVFGDGIQSALNGIIKGCGRQCIIMPIVLAAYWIVGVPLAYYLAFIRHGGVMCSESYFCGVRGLVTGMTVGTYVHMVLLALVVVGTTNWSREAERAKARMSLEKEGGRLGIGSPLKDIREEANAVGIMSL